MKLRTSVECLVIAATCLLGQSPSVSAGMIVNGDFTASGVSPDPFDGWTTVVDPGFFTPPVDDSAAAKFVALGSQDPYVQLEQEFELTGGETTLSFDIKMTTSADPVGSPRPYDSFQATLFAPVFPDSVLPIEAGVLDAFYSIDASGFEDESDVSYGTPDVGWKRVILNVSSLSTGFYTIDFLALGADDGIETTFLVDNVVLSSAAVPEPATIAIWAVLGTVAFGMRRKRSASRKP